GCADHRGHRGEPRARPSAGPWPASGSGLPTPSCGSGRARSRTSSPSSSRGAASPGAGKYITAYIILAMRRATLTAYVKGDGEFWAVTEEREAAAAASLVGAGSPAHRFSALRRGPYGGPRESSGISWVPYSGDYPLGLALGMF